MRTIWPRGLGSTGHATQLGQWGELISAGIQAGVQYEIARENRRQQDKFKRQAEAQAAALKAQQDSADKKRSEDAQKAIEAQKAGAPVPGAPGATSQILGMDSSTFYVGAGVLGIGAIVIALIATR